MSIEFKCPHCDSLLRVEDANSGKRARCPQCGVINRIPGELANKAAVSPVSQQFFIDSVSGQTYGPVTKQDLDSWVSQGRISADCLIRGTGQTEGQPASVYYPSLSQPTSRPNAQQTSGAEQELAYSASAPSKETPYNPYVAPIPVKAEYQQLVETGGFTPVRIDLGEVFTHAYQIFMRNIGLLIAVAVVCAIPQLLSNIIEYSAEDARGNIGPIAWLATICLNLVSTFLLIGQLRISIRLVRGQQADFGELFSGGDKFLAIIGFSLLIAIPLILGFLLFIVPGIFMLLYFWPCYSLIIDHKATVFDSFSLASRIGERNLFNSFALGLASFGIGLLGLMICIIGLVPASAFVSVLWAAAYLMMSGQVATRHGQ